MATIKDIGDLTKASSIAGTEKIPISGTEYVDLAQVKEYSTPDVDGSISTHNTSTTAHADIRTLIGSCVGLPTYDSSTYELTFATTSGTSLVIDLPIEQMNLDYNDTTNAIEFVKADGTTASIPVSDFLSEYVGSIGDQIQISIESGNTIKATLIDGTVTLVKLSTSLQSKIGEIDSKVDAVSGMGLSSNDYTSTEKSKLAGIAEGANKTLYDTTPTENSTNAVTSGGVKSYVDTAVGELSSVATVTGYSGATAMESGVSYVYSSSPSTVTFSLASVASGRIGIYSLKFTTGTSVPTFSYPSGLEWVGGELTLEASTTYELNIFNGVVTYISY